MDEIETTVEFVGGPLDGSTRPLPESDGYAYIELRLQNEGGQSIQHLYVIDHDEVTKAGYTKADYFSFYVTTLSDRELDEISKEIFGDNDNW